MDAEAEETRKKCLKKLSEFGLSLDTPDNDDKSEAFGVFLMNLYDYSARAISAEKEYRKDPIGLNNNSGQLWEKENIRFADAMNEILFLVSDDPRNFVPRHKRGELAGLLKELAGIMADEYGVTVDQGFYQAINKCRKDTPGIG